MRKLPTIVTIFILFWSCTSTPEATMVTGKKSLKPDETVGCSQYSGRERLQCTTEMVKLLENFHNSSLSDKVVQKTRTGFMSQFLVIERRACVVYEGTELRCWSYTKKEYSPHWSQEIADRLLFVLLGIGIGIGI